MSSKITVHELVGKLKKSWPVLFLLGAVSAYVYVPKIYNAHVKNMEIVKTLQSDKTVDASLLNGFSEGKEVTVWLDEPTCPKQGDQGDPKDQLGSIRCGETYKLKYCKETDKWITSGYNSNSDKVINHDTFVLKRTEHNQSTIYIFGRNLYVRRGLVEDTQYGNIGRIELAKVQSLKCPNA